MISSCSTHLWILALISVMGFIDNLPFSASSQIMEPGGKREAIGLFVFRPENPPHPLRPGEIFVKVNGGRYG
jgi:hypothetical protein